MIIFSQKIQDPLFFKLIRNDKIFRKKTHSIFRKLSLDRIKINSSVLKEYIYTLESKLNSNFYTEREKQVINHLITKLNNVYNYFQSSIPFQIDFNHRLLFYPIYNLNRNIIFHLLKRGIISNLKEWTYFDASSAEARSILILKYLKMRDPLYLNYLSRDNVYSYIHKEVLKSKYSLSYIKRFILVSIHNKQMFPIEDKDLNSIFNLFRLDDIDEKLFVKTTQFFVLQSIENLLKQRYYLFFLNYDGGYFVKID